MKPLLRFLRTWMLAVSMLAGGGIYCLWRSLPPSADHEISTIVGWLQPTLIFFMLFITFCKVDPRRLSFRKWHVFLLLFQLLGAGLIVALFLLFPNPEYLPLSEAALLCLLCPTATAAAVVTSKLRGDVEGITTYTLLSNLMVALAVPMIASLFHVHPWMSFVHSFYLIVAKIFPILILPFLVAMTVRLFFKKLHLFLLGLKDFAFYLWAVSLALAIAVSIRSLVSTPTTWWIPIGISVVSLLTCCVQFYFGRKVGVCYNSPIASAQALGQKNTVFLIWVGYTFFDPVSSIAGGFYAIYHNLRNNYELARHNKLQKEKS